MMKKMDNSQYIKLSLELYLFFDQLINFKNNVLNSVLSCQMYTTNYPLFINDDKMYRDLLIKVVYI